VRSPIFPQEQGAIATMEKIMSAGKEDNGKFLNIKVEGFENAQGANYYDGEIVLWWFKSNPLIFVRYYPVSYSISFINL
jgi:hypothetical protein